MSQGRNVPEWITTVLGVVAILAVMMLAQALVELLPERNWFRRLFEWLFLRSEDR